MTLTYTVSDLITAAYRTVGIVADTGNATTEQLNTGLVTYNLMVKSWSSIANDTWGRADKTFSLTAGTASYLLGPGAGDDVDIPRPYRILNAYRTFDSQDVPLTQIGKQQYFSLPTKTSTGLPVQFSYQPGTLNGTLYVWPVPAAADLPCTMTIDYVKTMGVAALSDTPDMPDEWQEATMLNLAVRLADKYGKPLSQTLMIRAQESLDRASNSTYEAADVIVRPVVRNY